MPYKVIRVQKRYLNVLFLASPNQPAMQRGTKRNGRIEIGDSLRSLAARRLLQPVVGDEERRYRPSRPT